MKVFDTIDDLLTELHVTKKSVSPDFFILKFDDLDYARTVETFPHYKRFFEIAFYEENKNEVQVGHTKMNDLSDSIMFTSPMQSLSVIRKEKPVGIIVFFKAKFFTPKRHQYDIQHEFPFFKLNTKPSFKISKEEKQYIKQLLEAMHREFENNEAQCVEIIQSYLNILLNYMKRILKGESGNVKLKRYEELTNAFEELLLEETGKYKTIAEYASLLNITPIYLSECTKRANGRSAKQILTNYQMLRAKSLLVQTTKSIEEISMIMGFEEATNFIKFFKNNEGVTPSVFRKLP
ncbi:helix-turn-helix domain-containing protein [Aestuariibaculum marinum]|uniref:Helix-turn-helix transcriptional regulator n=1 Tax=Aestuariibaculum marinum TaxID=2683592 RepID=A0A8J6PX59_9FLAO|nr:helix-turn-helix transcriptional regulator [Aestuariibaculum marinum]MBD0825230.1 helix-turn-helix transcriptional regulator [Aestuariibaculum marinum]